VRHAASNQPGSRRGPLEPAYAALDLGTHNCRLLVASACGNSFKVIDSFSRIVRLGEGLGASGDLSCEAVNRTIGALKVCANKIKSNGVIKSRSVATEACRQANNGTRFLGRVKAETGLHLETISSSEEAQLTLEGCMNLIDRQIQNAVVFDIGGGSTEIMWVQVRKDGTPQMIDTISIPSGVVSLCEEFGSDAIGQSEFTEIGSHFIDALDAFDERNKISQHIENDQVQMLGTSGTVTTLGAIYLNLPRYDRSKVDGLNLGCENIASISAQLANMDCLDRAKHPCIGQGRADLVVMGCAVLSTICKRWPVGSIRVADRGIREGLLNRMINQNR
jgi:exopolyphosphatase / guanosine-5'-triphosphate,3'-diphosphate pyrophosphatase